MYRPIFVNASNPQLRLLADFLAVMANTNTEATLRVFRDSRIAIRGGTIYIYGPTESVDAMVAPVSEDPITEPNVEERIKMLTDIFGRIRRNYGTDGDRDNTSGESDQHPV